MEDLSLPQPPENMSLSDAFDETSGFGGRSRGRFLLDMLKRNGRRRSGCEGVDLTELLDAYQAALDRHAIVAMTDRRGRLLFANSQFCAVSGYSEDELVGRPHSLINSGHHPPTFFKAMWRTIADGRVWHGEICNRAKDGSLYWVDTTVVPLTGSDGRVEAYMSIRYDITKRKAAEQALREEVERRRKAEALLVDVIETVPDGIAAFDTDDRLVLYNRSYASLHPRSADAVRIGATFESILADGLANGQFALPRKTEDARQAWLRGRLRAHRNPGRSTAQELSDGRWIQIRERRSASGHVVGTHTDITELKRSESAVRFLAEHDPLTGLLNRSVLSRRLGDAVAGCRRGGGGLLMVADLDGFKQINDTMGHAAGDALLAVVARRMSETLRRSDTIVRLGGDEFAVVVPQLAQRGSIDVLAQRLIAAIQHPATIQRRTVTPKISIGIARFPQDGQTLKGLLRKADMALYRAKSEGRGTHRIFSRAMRAEVEQRRQLATALSAAVTGGAIDIALQPQFTLADPRALTGFEALARWNHQGRAVSPAEFIPVAEENGFIADLGIQVLDKALEVIGGLRRKGIATGTLAVNVASAQIRDANFPAILQAAIRRHGLAPADLEIELTENILLDTAGDEIARTLRTLREAGFTIALDDFGTGYASLAHLGRFPIDRIKIDRGFVSRMCGGQDTCTIVRAIIGLAHALGMTVVAEGIETPGQLEQLQAFGCDFGQGYLFSRPVAPRQLAACFPSGSDFTLPAEAWASDPPS